MRISSFLDIPLLAINARLVIELASVPHGTIPWDIE